MTVTPVGRDAPPVLSAECHQGDCKACAPCEHACHVPATSAPEGQWMVIAFMGHNELTGYVTDVTVGGQPGFHVDLPEKVWGGNEFAWEEYAGSALYSRRPVSEGSVRAAWVAAQKQAEARRAQQAEWERMDRERALPAGEEGGHTCDDDCADSWHGERDADGMVSF